MGGSVVDGTSQGSANPAWVLWWWPIFVVAQIVAFGVVLALDPAGLDPCGAEGPGPRSLQAVVAGASLVASAVLAIWRLRHRALVAALAAVLLTVILWLWLLGGSQGAC